MSLFDRLWDRATVREVGRPAQWCMPVSAVTAALRRGLAILVLMVTMTVLSGCGWLVAGALTGAGEAIQENAERAQ